MIPYAARVTAARQLKLMKEYNWRHMLSAAGRLGSKGLEIGYALDNGAWYYHKKNKPFNDAVFTKAFERYGMNADFVVAPDIVGGGLASLKYSMSWINRLYTAKMILIPAQENIEPHHMAPLLSSKIGVFVGGADDKWKERTIPIWANLAKEYGAYCHVGRVNTKRRMAICFAAGVDSFDGSGPAIWAKHLEKMQRWLVEIENG